MIRPVAASLAAGLFVVLVGSSAADVRAQIEPHADQPLGTVIFPISCSAPAQVEFNHALALLHHMTYPQARAAFQRVATLDPRCAMAQWGIAMTLFQPLWPTRPSAEALQQGWDAVQLGTSLQPPTERERLFLSATEAFFLEPAAPDYWLRIRRWAAATERVYAAYPDDDDADAFQALALLATAPIDTMARGNASLAAEILLRVYRRSPDHPGAIHYLVHANDASGREHESLEITHRYDSIAPDNPHALHMPTHIYTRLGDWDGVIRGNLLAAEAALQYPAGDRGQFVWDEFPHAIEYLVYAELQQGADSDAAAEWQRLRTTAHLEPSFKTAFHLSSIPARYALERRDWRAAARLVPRSDSTLDWNRFAWPEAITWFARGLGSAHLRDIAAANAASRRLVALEAVMHQAGEELFARNIRVLSLELNGWIAHAAGQQDSSATLMRAAAALEAATPKHAVTPAPMLPAEELLGDLFMEQKRPGEALAAYQRSLERYPRRFNALLGAARAEVARGDAPAARTWYQALLAVADGGTREPALSEARRYLARQH